MALQAGSTLSNGHYRIVRQIGRGGFGFVYLAEDTLLAEQVAIKELIPALVGDEVMLRRFLAEAKATMRLTHRQIVRTYNVFSESGNYYIVMEYMPGGSLELVLQRQRALPLDDALRVAAEVCEGLACAHQDGVVHCDLKPHNILFAADGSAKVADFGIAHVSGEMLTRSWMTPAGFVAGTLPYMSPEQTDGVRDDPRVDVYALGAVLFRMLTGRTYLEFDQRETPRAQAVNVQRIYGEKPLPPSAHDARIPAWLDAIVLKSLAKRPEDRYQTADAMRVALAGRGEALGGPAAARAQTPPPRVQPLPATAPPVPPTQTARPGTGTPAARPRRRGLSGWFWLLLGVALILVLAIGIAVVALLGGTGDGGIAAPGSLSPTAAPPAVEPTEPAVPPTEAPAEPGPLPPVGEDLLDQVRAAGVLVVSTGADYPPQSFRNDAGEMDGFDADVAREVARRLGVEVEFVTPDWGEIPGGNWGGRWDVNIGSMAPTPERAEALWFVAPYYYIPAHFATHRDNRGISRVADLAGKRVGVATETTYEAYLKGRLWAPELPILYEPPPGIELRPVPSDFEALEILAQGDGVELDAVLAAQPIIQEFIAGGGPLKYVLTPPFYEPLVFALDKSRGPSERLLGQLGEIVATMHADGTLSALSEKWFGIDLTTIREPGEPAELPPEPAAPPSLLIAFASDHEGNYELYCMQADGSEVRRLTETPVEEWHPDWSPDGGRIVFQCMSPDSGSNVCVVNADGGDYRQITDWGPDQPGAQRPVWEPGGQQIAVSREPPGGGMATIWVMDAGGGEQREIAEGRDPSWSPDGRRIAFIRRDDSALQIWTVSPDGGNLEKLTEGDADHMYPTWSPDGRQLAFEFDHNQVAVMPAGGGPPRTVIEMGSWNLTWAPNGLRLAIAPSQEAGIWLVNLDGTGLQRILEIGTQPDWQPLP
jgi:polar amino acid transport system substrate-binding protein